ncbi:MAG TPA: hypothetical protein VI136_12250 [Verrucomicrobiae bacterium]
MSNMVLQCKETGDFKPHPEGIHPAVCVDVMDLGLVETEFQGQRRMVNKVKVVFESEAKTEDGKPCMVSKNFTASLHPKAKLAEFLGKWRGRLVVPGETIELAKLIGASCTLVISHQQNMVGKTYANIDAISKPTRKVSPSGTYDPAAARQRYAEWKTRQAGSAKSEVRNPKADGGNNPAQAAAVAAPPANGVSKSPAASTPPADFDPEVGF